MHQRMLGMSAYARMYVWTDGWTDGWMYLLAQAEPPLGVKHPRAQGRQQAWPRPPALGIDVGGGGRGGERGGGD